MSANDATNRRVSVVPELLTVAEAALELRVSAATVRRWMANGMLEAVVLPSGRRRVPMEALSKMQRLPSHLEPGQLRRHRRGG